MGGACSDLKSELTRENLGLRMNERELAVFARSPTCINSQSAFAWYRTLVALGWLGILFWSLSLVPSIGWFIALTHWQLLVWTVYACSAAVASWTLAGSKYDGYEPPRGDADYKGNHEVTVDVDLKCQVRCTWVLMNIAYSLTFFVFVLFWALVYNPNEEAEEEGEPCHEDDGAECEDPEAESNNGEMMFVMILTHGIPFLFALIDVLLSGAPFRFMHFWHVEVLLALFFVMSYLYTAATGEGIYPIINYAENPISIGLGPLLMATFVPGSQLFLWFIWKASRSCTAAYTNSGGGAPPPVEI